MKKTKSTARSVYRKWSDPQDGEHFLTISPDGKMLEISFAQDGIYGHKIGIYQTGNLNPLDSEVFRKHKEVCSKKEWSEAVKKIVNLVKGKIA